MECDVQLVCLLIPTAFSILDLCIGNSKVWNLDAMLDVGVCPPSDRLSSNSKARKTIALQ